MHLRRKKRTGQSCRFQNRTRQGLLRWTLPVVTQEIARFDLEFRCDLAKSEINVGTDDTRPPSAPRHTSRRARRRPRSELSDGPRGRPAPTARHVRRCRAGPARGGRPRGGHRPQGGGCARGRRRARGSAREGERRGPRARSGRRRGDLGCQNGHFPRVRRPRLRRRGGTRPRSASLFPFLKTRNLSFSLRVTRRVALSVARLFRSRRFALATRAVRVHLERRLSRTRV